MCEIIEIFPEFIWSVLYFSLPLPQLSTSKEEIESFLFPAPLRNLIKLISLICDIIYIGREPQSRGASEEEIREQ